MTTTKVFLVALGAFILNQHASPRFEASQKAVCATPETDTQLTSFAGYLKGYVSNPNLRESRARRSIPELSADSVVIVRDDSLCARAAVLLGPRHDGKDIGRQKIRLARLGPVYWAEDGSQAGEWTMAAILDHNLSRTLHSITR